MVDEDEKTLKVWSTKSICNDQFEGASEMLKSLLSIRPDKPCHKIQESVFSSSSGYVDYSGVVNFSLIVMVLSNAHVALESIKTNGILYDPVELLKMIYFKVESPSSLILLFGLHIFALCSFGIEVLLSKGHLSEKFGLTIIITLLTSDILIPAIALNIADSHFIAAGLVASVSTFFFLKFISYHITNAWCRESHARTQNAQKLSISPCNGRDTENDNAEKNLVHYPDNLNIKDLFYYFYAPTLCYELNFPRSARVKKMFLFKRVLEMIILPQLLLFLIQQCILPTFNETLKPLQEMDYSSILEKYFKVIVPYITVFFLAFYTFYHSFLNALAEMLRFGDRYFYSDFWNAGTIMDFWQKWAIPVHKFALRHIYLPLRQRGFSHYQTLTVFFFTSAALHEYVFGVALKMFRYWSFLLLLVQVPYFMLDKWLDEKYGNMVAFTFFLIALPFYNLMYYQDYCTINYQNVEASA